MDGGNHFTSEAAQVAAGAATAAGGYLYFTAATGWRLVVGAFVTFGGGWIGHSSIIGIVGGNHGLAAGLAATATLGVIFSVRKAASKLDAAQWLEGKK